MSSTDHFSLEEEEEEEEGLLRTLDTMKDANDILTKDPQPKLQQSLLISESAFVKISSLSSSSEPHQTRTPSPGCTRSTHDDHSSANRYSNYDNRPMKPLNRDILQSKLNQYPVETTGSNVSRTRAASTPQQMKRIAIHSAYNANRYSPKSTPHEPAASAMMRPKSNKPSTARPDQTKRHTIAADNAHTLHTMNRAVPVAKTKYKHSKYRRRKEQSDH